MCRPERHRAVRAGDASGVTPREKERAFFGVVSGRFRDVGPEQIGLELIGLAVRDTADRHSGVHGVLDVPLGRRLIVGAGSGIGGGPQDQSAGELLLLLLVEVLRDVVARLVPDDESDLVVVPCPLQER